MNAQSLSFAKRRASIISERIGQAVMACLENYPVNPSRLLSFLYLLHDLIMNAASSTLPLVHLLLTINGCEDQKFLPSFLPKIF